MIEFTNKPNPKALNLEGLDEGSKKVTIGFKCNPRVKLKLAQEAGKVGMTLSEHVENILLTAGTQDNSTSEELKQLKEQISFYENKILLDFFKKHKGEEFDFTNAVGVPIKVKVNEPKDIYTVLINSFKLTK